MIIFVFQNRHCGLVVRPSVLQSTDVGSIPFSSHTKGFKYGDILNLNSAVVCGLVFRASVLQSIDLGSVTLSSHTKNFKCGNIFPA